MQGMREVATQVSKTGVRGAFVFGQPPGRDLRLLELRSVQYLM